MKALAIPADFVQKNAKQDASILKRKKWIFHVALPAMIALKLVLKME
jgi:hypothetical protein